MKLHEQRVVDEKIELDEKISKLNVFLQSELFETLSEVNKDLLSDQFEVMNKYSRILNARIAEFTE
jgi:hypothetical protein